jgi:hypothetical protein
MQKVAGILCKNNLQDGGESIPSQKALVSSSEKMILIYNSPSINA